MTRALLEVSDLSMRFGGLIALAEVELALNKSEVLCIIGPNGAGKSTLFNLVSGIYQPTAGRVVLDGADITGWPAHRIASAGIARTFQSSRLFNDLTLVDNVMIGMHTRTTFPHVATAWRGRCRRPTAVDLRLPAHWPRIPS